MDKKQLGEYVSEGLLKGLMSEPNPEIVEGVKSAVRMAQKMANEKLLIDANELFRRLNSFIATAIHRGVENIPMGKDSSSATEFLRGYERGAVEAANLALGQQPVDAVEVVHGRWIPTNNDNHKRCSQCDVIHLIAQYPHGEANYCPNCGAKMDGGNEDG